MNLKTILLKIKFTLHLKQVLSYADKKEAGTKPQ